MKKTLTLLMAAGFCLLSLCGSGKADALSESLTTTIIVTVKPLPKTDLMAEPQMQEPPKEHSSHQSPSLTPIKVQNINSSGENIYTIIDKL